MGVVDLFGVAWSFIGSGGILLSALDLLQDLKGSRLLFYGGDLLLDLLEGWRASVSDYVTCSTIRRRWFEWFCIDNAFLLT